MTYVIAAARAKLEINLRAETMGEAVEIARRFIDTFPKVTVTLPDGRTIDVRDLSALSFDRHSTGGSA